MVMKYSFLCSLLIFAVSLQLSSGEITNIDNVHEQLRPNKLRGSWPKEGDGERSLDGYRNGYRNGNNGYGGGNGYYANGHYNNYRNRGYYRSHYYYPRQYYAYSKYYGNDEEQGNEDTDSEVDDATSSSGSGSGSGNSSHDVTSEVEEQFWEWYDSPPADWTPAQWAWFAGLLSFSVGFLFCCCLGFANVCVEGQDKVCCCCGGDSDYNERYRSIDREKSGSFMTINSKASNVSTTGGSTNMSLNTAPSDDEVTYDSIMRMRSASSS